MIKKILLTLTAAAGLLTAVIPAFARTWAEVDSLDRMAMHLADQMDAKIRLTHERGGKVLGKEETIDLVQNAAIAAGCETRAEIDRFVSIVMDKIQYELD